MHKVAIPTKNKYVDSHFGQAEAFNIITLEDGEIKHSETVDSGQGCVCRSNIIRILKEKGVSVMLAGDMGEGAYQKLIMAGIEVIRGCHGKIESVLEKYKTGLLTDSGDHCPSPGHGHRSHHHEHMG